MFERFTDRARRVVVLAQEEARLLGHGYIGTEHILLGLIREDEGMAGHALAALGVRLEPARQAVKEIIGEGKQQAPSGHIPFTPRAKKTLELSLREALQLGHDYIGTEHILLGLLREGEGVALEVLAALGAGQHRVRQQVLQLAQSPAAGEPALAGHRLPRELRYRGGGFGDLLGRLDEISARLEAIERHLGITRRGTGTGEAAVAPVAGEAAESAQAAGAGEAAEFPAAPEAGEAVASAEAAESDEAAGGGEAPGTGEVSETARPGPAPGIPPAGPGEAEGPR